MGGCVSAPPEPGQRAATPGDCLRKVQIDQLDAALQRCNAVVTALPDDPQPRNDRSLLYSLAGNNAAACRDSFKAAELLERSRPRRGDQPAPAELPAAHQSASSCRTIAGKACRAKTVERRCSSSSMRSALLAINPSTS